MQGQDYFIVSNGPKLDPDPDTRFLIRSRASTLAACGRKRPRKQVKSSLQRKRQTQAQDNPHETVFDGFQYIPPYLCAYTFSSAYEKARAKHNADITLLSKLACFNIGGFGYKRTNMLSKGLDTVLDRAKPSYLQHVPGRYGTNECLTLATDCVLRRMSRMLGSACPRAVSEETRAYGRALRALRYAIEETKSADAETLCASQLLALYELLEDDTGTSYVHHVNGSAQIIKHRKPKSFKTSFDRALFAANAEPMMSYTLASGEHSYLESSEWLSVYEAMVNEPSELTPACRARFKARMQSSIAVSLWIDSANAIQDTTFFSSSQATSLQQRCLTAFDSIMIDYGVCKQLEIDEAAAIPDHIELWYDMMGYLLSAEIVVRRLLATLDDSVRLDHEVAVQQTARVLAEQRRALKEKAMYSAHASVLADTVIATADAWSEDTAGLSLEERRHSSVERFKDWQSTFAVWSRNSLR